MNDEPREIYYTSDLHLGHEKIIELCGRPFGSVQEMNRELLMRINDTVRSKTLVVLGDVLLGKFDESVKLLAEIRAETIIIMPGNHDRFSLAYRHSGSVEKTQRARAQWLERYQEANPAIQALPDRQPSAWGTMLDGRPVLMSHYPYQGDSRSDAERYGWLRPVDSGMPLIHGHVHGRWREGPGGRMLNVGVDVNDFAPVSEAAVVEWLTEVPMGVEV